MVFWVIVYIDSYLYTQKKIATPLYMGVGVKQNSQSKNGTRSNRDPKYDMYDNFFRCQVYFTSAACSILSVYIVRHKC